MNLREIWLSGSELPIAMLLIGLVVTGFFVRWIYYRVFDDQPARHLWWLRFAAIALTLLALADLTRKQFQVQLPTLVIAIDNSGSMKLPNELGDTSSSMGQIATRIDVVKSALTIERLNRLSKRFRISLWEIGGLPQPVERNSLNGALDGSHVSSELGDSLVDLIKQHSNQNVAALLVLSDGAVTSGQSLRTVATVAQQDSIPVFVAGMGSPDLPANVRIENLQANRRVRINEPLLLNFELNVQSLAGQSVDIIVSDKVTGEELHRQAISIGGERFRRTMSARIFNEQPGPRTILIQATTKASESSKADNRIEKQIEVIDGKTRVLIVQGSPSPWFRFLKKTLLRATDTQTGQNAFQIKTLLQQASSGYQQIDDTAIVSFPLPQQLHQFDVVVIGDVLVEGDRAVVSPEFSALTGDNFRDLTDYITLHGGNVVLVPGPNHTRAIEAAEQYRSLLPIDSDAAIFGTGLNESPGLDRTNRLMMRSEADSFSPTRWLAENMKAKQSVVFSSPIGSLMISRIDSSAVVLAEFDSDEHETNAPAITTQKMGSGNVVTHFTDELYRLRFRSDANLFENYWIRLVTNLSAERLQRRDAIALVKTDATKYRVGESVIVTAEAFDPSLNLQTNDTLSALLVKEDGQSQSIELQQSYPGAAEYGTRLNKLSPGKYQLLVSTPALDSVAITTDFEIAVGASELAVQNQQRETLSSLANSTGGAYFDSIEHEKIWSSLPSSRWNQVGSAHLKPIWNWRGVPFGFGLLVIGLLVVEWISRRKMRLE